MKFEKIKKLLHRHKYIELFPTIPVSGAKMCYLCGAYKVYDGNAFRFNVAREEEKSKIARITSEDFAGRMFDLLRAEHNQYGVDYEILLMCRACNLLLEGIDPEEVLQIMDLEKFMGVGYTDLLKQTDLWGWKDGFQ